MVDPNDPTPEPLEAPEPTPVETSNATDATDATAGPASDPDMHTDDDGITWHRREDPAVESPAVADEPSEDQAESPEALEPVVTAAIEALATAQTAADFDAIREVIDRAARTTEGRTIIRAALRVATDDELSAECIARGASDGDEPDLYAKQLARQLQNTPDLAVAVVSQLRIAGPWEGREGDGRRRGLDGRGDLAVTQGVEWRSGRLVRVKWRLLIAPPGERPAFGDASSEEEARTAADSALALVPGYAVATGVWP